MTEAERVNNWWREQIRSMTYHEYSTDEQIDSIPCGQDFVEELTELYNKTSTPPVV